MAREQPIALTVRGGGAAVIAGARPSPLLGAQRDIDVEPWPLLDWTRRYEVAQSNAPMIVHG
jgi:hypothetical protein